MLFFGVVIELIYLFYANFFICLKWRLLVRFGALLLYSDLIKFALILQYLLNFLLTLLLRGCTINILNFGALSEFVNQTLDF